MGWLRCLAWFLASIMLLSTAQPLEALDEERPLDLQYVFLILSDGLNTDGYRNNPTSNIQFLANEGILDVESTTLPADTVEEGIANLLTGTFPDEHQHYTMNDRVEVESIMDVLQKAGKSGAIIDGSGGKIAPFARGEGSYLHIDSKSSDQEVFNNAIQHFNAHKPFFTAIYCNDMLEGLLSIDKKAYYRATVAFDRGLGVFLDNLRNQGLLDKSLIILTAPRSSSAKNNCPLIMHGPNCKPASRVENTMGIDVCPTISRMMGVSKPYNARGTAIYDALNVEGEEESNMLRQWIKELKEQRLDTWKKYLALEDKLNRTIHQMTAIKEEKQSIFDFAGEREQIIAGLKSRANKERLIFLGIILLMGLGYLLEYRLLKKKFLLFR